MKTKNDVCDETVYTKLYTAHAKSIWNFIYFKCGNVEEANDLVQEAFIKLWQNCTKVSIEKAKPFLYTVVNNTFLNEVAHRKVILKYAKTQLFRADIQSPEFLLEEKQYLKKIEIAISNLTEAQRTAFLLNRIEGKKYKEIAEILNISLKAVEKRMSQALSTLRKEIENI